MLPLSNRFLCPVLYHQGGHWRKQGKIVWFFFKDSLHIFLSILFALPYNKGNTPVSFDPETEIDL